MAHVIQPSSGIRPTPRGWEVHVAGRFYGRYRSRAMAQQRMEQVAMSRLPVRTVGPESTELR